MAIDSTRRTTMERRLEVLAQMMRTGLRLDKNIAGYRVETSDGARQISPRLRIVPMIQWIEAGISVLNNTGRGGH